MRVSATRFISAALFAILALPLMARAALPVFTPIEGVNLNRVSLDISTTNNGSQRIYRFTPFSDQECRSQLTKLTRVGFTGVRLNVSILPVMQDTQADKGDSIKEVETVVKCALSSGLKVVITLQTLNSTPVWKAPDIVGDKNQLDLYLKAVSTAAEMVSRQDPAKVALETFNEPTGCEHSTAGKWSVAQKQIYHAARALAPRTTLILTGDCWGTAKGLASIDPDIFDSNTYFSIHFYEPYLFTNQGSYGSDAYTNFISRVHFPPNSHDATSIRNELTSALSKATLSEQKREDFTKWATNDVVQFYGTEGGSTEVTHALNAPFQWAKDHKVPSTRMFVGEFGVRGDYQGHQAADIQDRATWIAEVRKVISDHGASWCVYALSGPWGIEKDDSIDQIDSRLIGALGLSGRRN